MTTYRRDSHSTEFGLWLRNQKDIDSKLGYIATNIDYMWMCYKNNSWMLIEEKRYQSKINKCQRNMFLKIHQTCQKGDKINYKGFHLIIFENTNPDDGKMWLDGKQITKDELIIFLRMVKENNVKSL